MEIAPESDRVKLFKAIQQTIDCCNGQHKYEPYRKGTVKCSVCGKFAKVGYLTMNTQEENR